MSELKGMVVFAVSEPLEDGSFFIKKSIRDGSLAIFDEEKDAERQLRRNDIKGNVVNELVVVRKEVVASVGSKLTALTEINRLQSEENKQLAEDNAELRNAIKVIAECLEKGDMTRSQQKTMRKGLIELLESMKCD